MPGRSCADTVARMPRTNPSDMSLREMLEQRRLAHRDRRLEHVISALRARADAQPASGSLLQAIAEFSREHSTVRRRLREIAGDDSRVP